MKIDYWSSTKKIQQKENSTENSAEKNLKENSKFNELWNFFPDTLSDKFPANCIKNLQHFIFSISFFLISLYKIPLKNLYCQCYLFEQISELESCRTYCLNLPFEIIENKFFSLKIINPKNTE